MTYEPFENDLPWMRFRCLELAKDITKSRSIDKVMDAARTINQFVMPIPKCKIIKLRKRK